MISGVANLAGTAAGMEQSRKQNRDYMNMLFGNDNNSFTPMNPDGSEDIPVMANGQLDLETMRAMGMISTPEDMPPGELYPTGVINGFPGYSTGTLAPRQPYQFDPGEGSQSVAPYAGGYGQKPDWWRGY
jgi:hypothetical protein